jgi:hypothetical protein
MPFKIPEEIGLLGESKLGNVKFKGANEPLDSSREAEQGSVIEFIPIHYKNTPVISFIAFLGDIKDDIKQTFQPEQPFGRTDPIQIWKASSRVITLNFKIPSSDEEMALRNINNLSWLMASSYPTYEKSQCATSIVATPLYRVKFANIIANTNNRNGILCAIPGFSVSHELKNGAIHVHSAAMKSLAEEAGFPTQAKEIIVARTISVSCTLNVLHEHSLGWDVTTGEWRGGGKSGYPYGFGLVKDAGDPQSKGSGGTAHSSDTGAATAGNSTSTDSRESAAAAEKNLGG